MRGKIENTGVLLIGRPRRFAVYGVRYTRPELYPMWCPYSSTTFCGDSCPLFGELLWGDLVVQLPICQDRVLVFDEFIDERTGESTEGNEEDSGNEATAEETYPGVLDTREKGMEREADRS